MLEAENFRLSTRVAELEAALVDTDFLAPVEWRLTALEAQMFAMLLKRELVSKAGLMTALYGDRVMHDAPQPKIVDVLICKLRQKLAPFDISILTIWAQGYRLRPEDRARLRGNIEERRRA